jgi:hypothetical protein
MGLPQTADDLGGVPMILLLERIEIDAEREQRTMQAPRSGNIPGGDQRAGSGR